jgi:TRAP-type C4-dicarboxylate transport system substrate-binding protein
MPRQFSRLALMAAVAGIALPFSANAETTMRFSDYLPATHYLTVEGSMPFMEAITEATDGEVKFEHFPAQQLGKSTDFLRLTADNVAQISVVGVSFVADKMELSNVAQMPGAFESACNGLTAYNTILDTTELRQRDFTQHGVKLLFPYVLPPFEMATAERPIKTIEDIRGLKILVASRSTEILMDKMGASPLQATSGAAAYEQVTRGTIDGLIFAPDSIITYDLHTITKYGTANGNFGGQVVAVIMNQDAFDALDDETKAIFEEESQKAAQRVCEYVDQKKQEAIVKIRENGNELAEFGPEELKKLGEYSSEVATEWAQELDSRNLPGTATLEAFEAALPTN